MKIVGLNIEKGRVAASVVVKGVRQTELTESFSRDFATDAELADILKEKAAEWAHARVVSSIPGHHFSQRIVHFPFVDRTRIEKALPFEIEDNVPFSLDEVEIDHLVLGRDDKGGRGKKETSVLGILLRKTVLRQHLDLLASAGIDPQVIMPSYVGLYFVSKMIPVEGRALLINAGDLCVKTGNTVTACRSFTGIQTTMISPILKALDIEDGGRIEKAYLLSANERLSAELAGLGIAVEHVSPEFGGKKAAEPVSLGLALADQTNFRKGEFAYHLVDIGIRRRKRALIIAGIMAAALVAANIGVKSYLVQSSYGKLDREINAIYLQTFPGSKSVGDPVRQLRMKLEEAKKKFGVLGAGTSALDVMKAVTEGVPKEVRVSFQEFVLEGDRLKLQGEAESFESVDKMKAELQKSPLFTEVLVPDTRMGVGNKVKFRFDMKLKQTL